MSKIHEVIGALMALLSRMRSIEHRVSRELQSSSLHTELRLIEDNIFNLVSDYVDYDCTRDRDDLVRIEGRFSQICEAIARTGINDFAYDYNYVGTLPVTNNIIDLMESILYPAKYDGSNKMEGE